MYTITQHFVTFICLHCRLFCSFSTSHINWKYTQASYEPQINTSLFSFNPFTVHLCAVVKSPLTWRAGDLTNLCLYYQFSDPSSTLRKIEGSRYYRLSSLRTFVSVHLSLCLANLLRQDLFPHVIYSFSWPPCHVYDGTISGFHLVASYCLAQYEQVQIPTYVV